MDCNWEFREQRCRTILHERTTHIVVVEYSGRLTFHLRSISTDVARDARARSRRTRANFPPRLVGREDHQRFASSIGQKHLRPKSSRSSSPAPYPAIWPTEPQEHDTNSAADNVAAGCRTVIFHVRCNTVTVQRCAAPSRSCPSSSHTVVVGIAHSRGPAPSTRGAHSDANAGSVRFDTSRTRSPVSRFEAKRAMSAWATIPTQPPA